ncbi:MAG: 50S ribosomal protein L19 [Candidatus Celaenobacter antarcticus]|nr:50S ribosomal protein L19 [Candidatus Celaenobacter antarcticus]MDP8315306.1 50S ribosomal protein L19 [Candidatus Celaenobacter antarcticus]
MDILYRVGQEQMNVELPDFNTGDTIKVYYTIREFEKPRIQLFQGIVIQKKGSGVNKTFTVRKISHGVAVERIFPLFSPLIQKIEVVRYGRVRRSKLFYLRKLRSKSTKVKRGNKPTSKTKVENTTSE